MKKPIVYDLNPSKTYMIEFMQDTTIGALVHYSAPYTGYV